jgi:hypothetical protein
MNEKFWRMTHPKSEEEKARDRAAAATATAPEEKLVERSPPQKERSAPPPPDSISSKSPETASISGGAAAGGATSGSSPNKFGGVGVSPLFTLSKGSCSTSRGKAHVSRRLTLIVDPRLAEHWWLLVLHPSRDER